jgi:acetyl-CoA carboxylase/biotin carboxylase 1
MLSLLPMVSNTRILLHYLTSYKLKLMVEDITHQTGTFGPAEDQLFKLASALARKEGIPRIYISANSGARFAFAEEIKDKFQICWNNPVDPSKGVRHLYLSDADYTAVSQKGSVKAVKDPHDSNRCAHIVFNCNLEILTKRRWIITDIIGIQHGIGVENLSGSGLIAGETSLAYEEIFTITLVTGRSVGIGAYLVRLGQRTVQADGSYSTFLHLKNV